jgi:hypothetical protein
MKSTHNILYNAEIDGNMHVFELYIYSSYRIIFCLIL